MRNQINARRSEESLKTLTSDSDHEAPFHISSIFTAGVTFSLSVVFLISEASGVVSLGAFLGQIASGDGDDFSSISSLIHIVPDFMPVLSVAISLFVVILILILWNIDDSTQGFGDDDNVRLEFQKGAHVQNFVPNPFQIFKVLFEPETVRELEVA